MSVERRATRLGLDPRDAVGWLLALGLATWLVWNAALHGGSAVRPVGMIVGSGVAFVLGRFAGARRSWVHAVGVIVAVAVLVVPAWSDLVSDDPFAAPLEYQNANAALLLQALVAAATLIVGTTSDAARIGVIIVAAGIGVATIITGSTAAVVLSVAIGTMTILAVLGSCRRWMASALAAMLLLAISTTVVLGAVHDEPDASFVATSLTGRLALWHDGVVLTASHPWSGIGFGRFGELSPAAADPDVRHAHQEFLELAAETGVLGGLLLVGIFIWAILRVGTPEGSDAPIVAAGIAALGVHASVDYILHFPVIPFAAAVLAGAASGSRTSSDHAWVPFRETAS